MAKTKVRKGMPSVALTKAGVTRLHQVPRRSVGRRHDRDIRELVSGIGAADG